MGQNQEKEIIKENKYTLKVNEELNDMLKEEVKPVKPKINKTFNKKATKFLKLSCKGKLKNKFFSKRDKNNNEIENSDEEDTDDEEKEIYVNYITDLMDLIYTKNINYNLKNRANNTVYETVYDIRNILNTEEDLNNNKYNVKSCEVMNKIIDPEISDKINKEKNEEDKINKNNQEEGNINNKKKDESQDNNFFKNWDYHEDIFENENEGENEVELDLNSYENNEEINKNEVNNKEIKFKQVNNKKSFYNDNNNNLIFLDDIIKYKDDYDIKGMNDHISKVINLYKIFPEPINDRIENNKENNIENKIENNIENKIENSIKNKIENNNSNNNSFESENKNSEIKSDKEIFSIDKEININKRKETDSQNENFEIINNDEVYDESNKNNNDVNRENSNEIIYINNKNVSNYFKDDENLENINLENTEITPKNILNLSNIRYEQDNSQKYNFNTINKAYKPNNINDKNVSNLNLVYNGPKRQLKRNPNIKLYQKKTIDLKNKNIHKDKFKFALKNKAIISENNKNKNDIFFNTISSIHKKENMDTSNNIDYSNFNLGNLEGIYTHKKIRSKTPIIKIAKPKKIKKKKLIINNEKEKEKEEEYNLKPPEFEQDKMSITKAEMFYIPKIEKHFRSKTPTKQIYKKTEIIPKYDFKIDLIEEKRQKDKMNEDIKNIKKTINLVEEKIKSIEKMDKKYKNIYNINNRYTNNNINIRNISNITPITRNKKNKKKIKNKLLKTFEETDIKGYKDIMPTINKERIEKNKNNYKNAYLPRAKSNDIQLRKKKVKKEKKPKKNEIINSNYLFGKQKYNYQPIYQEKDNIKNMRVGMRKKNE